MRTDLGARHGALALLFVLALCALAFLVMLATQARAEPITLTIGEAEELLNGLASLVSQRDVIVKEGGAERVAKVQMQKGWTLPVIMAVAKNIDALKPDILTWQKAIDQRRLDFTGEDGKVSVEGQRKIGTEIQEKRAEVKSYDLARFKAAELKPDINEISPAVLSALRPILVDDAVAK